MRRQAAGRKVICAVGESQEYLRSSFSVFYSSEMKVAVVAALIMSTFGLKDGIMKVGEKCKLGAWIYKKRCSPGLECANVPGFYIFGVCKGPLGYTGCTEDWHCKSELRCIKSKCSEKPTGIRVDVSWRKAIQNQDH